MRHALRRLLSNPAFSLTAAITLAAAIGANALIFSVVNGVLLKPLPFADPNGWSASGTSRRASRRGR